MENVKIEGDEAIVTVDPEMFSLDVIYSAAYVLIDRAYFSFGGNPEEEVKVYIKAKEGENPGKIAGEFNNELVNYSVYFKQSEKNEDVRSAIIQRALGTNLEGEIKNLKDVEEFLSPAKKEGKE
ncbi:MAG: hypothetical protein ACLFSS_04145 [Candidatus Aenigmatarchaeota archaeon]